MRLMKHLRVNTKIYEFYKKYLFFQISIFFDNKIFINSNDININ